MGDSTFDQADLIKALSTSQAYQAAKFGGRAPAGKFGGLLDILLPAYQAAFPKAPAANLAMGARQAYNVRQYNKALYGQEQEALRQQNLRKAAVGGHYATLGIPKSFDSQGNPVYLEDSQYKQLGEAYGNKEGIQGIQDIADGKDPAFGALAPLDQVRQTYENNILKPGRDATEREAFYQQINQKNPYSLTGDQPAQQQQPTEPQFEGDPSIPQGLGSLQQKPLQAGTAYNQPITPLNRFLQAQYPADPKQIVDALAQKETGRHNQTTETQTAANNKANQSLGLAKFGLSKQEYQAKLKGGMFNRPPAAGRPTNIIDLMTPEQKAEYAARTARGDTKPEIQKDPELEILQAQYKYAPDKKTKAAIGKQIQTRMLSQAGDQLLQNLDISGALTPAPFGNISRQKLKSVGKSVAAQNGVVL